MTDTPNLTTDVTNDSPAVSEFEQIRAVVNSDAPNLDTAGYASNPVLVEHVAEIRRLGKRRIEDAIEIGRRLTECKKIVGHGNWLSWLDHEFGWSEATARNSMHVYQLAQSTSVNFTHLSLPVSAIYLLAAPNIPEAACSEILERVGAGERMSSSEVKDAIAKAKRTKAGTLEINEPENVSAEHMAGLDDHTAAEQRDSGHDQKEIDNRPRNIDCADCDSTVPSRSERLTDIWLEATVGERRSFFLAIDLDQIIDALPVEHCHGMEDRLIWKNRLQPSVKLTKIVRGMLSSTSSAEQITWIAHLNDAIAEHGCDFRDLEVRVLNDS